MAEACWPYCSCGWSRHRWRSRDADGDGFCADVDICPLQPNPSQADFDGDGFGDLCDTCPLQPNPAQQDPATSGLEGCFFDGAVPALSPPALTTLALVLLLAACVAIRTQKGPIDENG